MDQRRGAAPLFVRRVGEKNLGHDLVGCGAVEQPSRLSSDWISLRLIGARKDFGREENRRRRLCVTRWVGEAVVEAAAARSRNMGEDAVERDSSIFVGVEALIKEVAQKAPVLRDTFAIDP